MELQPLLSEYLFANGNLSLPGIGSLQLQQKEAYVNAADAQLMPPIITIVFRQNDSEEADEKLIGFISRHLQTSTEEADALLKKSKLQAALADAGANYTWPGVGVFDRNENGDVLFQAEALSQRYFPAIALVPIPAVAPEPVAIIEQPEIETDSQTELVEEPQELPEERVQKSRWWIGAVIIFILSLLLIIYRYL